MRVLHVIPSLAAVHGGPSEAMRTIEQALPAFGVETETATTDDNGPGQHASKPLGQCVAEESARRWYFRKSTEFYKFSRTFGPWVRRNVGNYDLVHIHALFSYTSTAAAWAARRAGVPYIVRPLGTLNSYGLQERRPALKRLSLQWVEGPVLVHAAAVHCTSAAEREDVEALGLRVRCATIPLAVSGPGRLTAPALALLAPQIAGKRVVLYLSRLDPKKNVEGLLVGFAAALHSVPDLHLVVAGGGTPDYVRALHAQAQGLQLAPAVTWLGHVQGELKAALLNDSTLFVLPSFSENFGIAVVEALHAGLPCIVAEGVAIAQDVAAAGAGLAVQPDPASIGAAIASLAADAPALASMSQRARQLVSERYSPAAMGASLAQLYAEVLRR